MGKMSLATDLRSPSGDNGAGSDAPFGQLRAQMIGSESDASDGAVFSSVLTYCSLILLGPILAFFVTKMGILSLILGWDEEGKATNVVSAIVAVVVLHLALGLFICKAYFGDQQERTKIRIGKKD